MKKRFFWARQEVSHGPGELWSVFLHRFRTMEDRQLWMDKIMWAQVIGGEDPEVRRIQRRIAQGEQISFPVEIG